MFQSAYILPKIISQIGFNQVSGECIEKIHPSLLIGNLRISALREVGGLLASNSIYNLVDQTNPSTYNIYTDWNVVNTYSLGDAVKYNGVVYVSLSNLNLGNTPNWDSNFWETNYSSYLRNKINEALQYTIQEFLVESHLQQQTKTTAFSTVLFEDRDISFVATNTNSFVGIQFIVPSFLMTSLLVSQIAINVDTPQTLPIYLYHSSSQRPISIQNITITAGGANAKHFYDVNFVLPYLSKVTDAKGSFYLGFYENDLIGNYKETTTYLKDAKHHLMSYIQPIKIVNTALNKPNLFLQQTLYSETFAERTALNVFFSTTFDYTFQILANINQFANLIFKDLAIRILYDCKNSTRSNAKSLVSIEKIDNILEGRVITNQFGGETLIKGFLALYKDAKKELLQNLIIKKPIFYIQK